MFAKSGEAGCCGKLYAAIKPRKGGGMNLPIVSSTKYNGNTPATRPARKTETAMSPGLLQQRNKLLKLRAALSERVKQLTGEACEETPNYSSHMADAATDSFDRDLTLGLASFEQEALYEVAAALKRIEDGTYGICELTGQPIPWRRLVAIPWTRFSLGAEKTIDNQIHAHIGALGTVRPAEAEVFEEEEIVEDESLVG
jgi:RNA polymerase-binding transcription factor DksA